MQINTFKRILTITLVIILLLSFYGWNEYRNDLAMRLISLICLTISLGGLIKMREK